MSTKFTLEQTLTELGGEARPSLASLQGLSDLGQGEINVLRSTWPGLPVERRRWAVQQLDDLAEDDFELDFAAVFKALLDDEDAEVRQAAVDGLWESDDPAVADRLLEILAGDPSDAVRAAAASALGHFAYLGETEEIPTAVTQRTRRGLVAAIQGKQALEVRRRAVEAVGFMSGDEDIRHLIEQAYASEDEDMRTSALFAMGRNCDPRWLPTLLRELESEDPRMRFEAARACGEIEDRDAVTPLLRLLVDPDLEVKLTAIQALGTIGGEQAVQALRFLTQSDDDSVVEAAEEALAEAEFAEAPLDFGLDEALGGLRPLDHDHGQDQRH